MVYTTAGKGDEGFNDSAAEGLQRAKDELGIELTEAEPEGSEQYSTFLRKFAGGEHDLVCGLSFEMVTPMKQVASDFSDQRFTIVDVALDAPNVASYLYREHEGCYLVGQLNGRLTGQSFEAGAGSTNEDLVVGFIGGKKNPVIEKFHAGYKAGVESLDADVEFRSAYAGTWTSPSKGKSIAESMYDEGADIVFPAAGGTGLGAFQAAQERSRYAVGVDKEQSKATPEYSNVILGSMVKRVGEAFYRSIENVSNGEHRGGEQTSLGLQEEGVDLVYGTDLGSEIPESVKSAVSEARSSIVDGDVEVPSTLG
jgi:basic membrane protein A